MAMLKRSKQTGRFKMTTHFRRLPTSGRRWQTLALTGLLLAAFSSLALGLPNIQTSANVEISQATAEVGNNKSSSAASIKPPTSKQPDQFNCSMGAPSGNAPDCSTGEFSIILQKIVQNDDILRRFREIERISEQNSNVSLSVSFDSTINIRPICVRELFRIIKSLASNELELKTMLEFASDTPSLNSKLTLANLKPSSFQQPKLFGSGAQSPSQPASAATSGAGSGGGQESGELSPASKLKRLLSFGRASSPAGQSNRLDFGQLRGLASEASEQTGTGCSEPANQPAAGSQQQLPGSATIGNEVEHADASGGSKTLAKALANVDHWISGLEKFTLTRQWAYIIKIFQGTESILAMFISKTSEVKRVPVNGTNSTQPTNKTEQAFLESLQAQLPEQALTLTNSLNSLFPWHVWPWNNLDLYSTIDTFLNHGIFAFSKTTMGPERRIDHLSEMLQTLFKSLKYDSFPKKCNDWSRIICDREAFFDKLVLAETGESSAGGELEGEQRAVKVRELAAGSRNQLTQELSCIMFSSLSMQHFGAKEDLELINSERQQLLNANNNGRLPWDKQVNKALKLYSLSREALTDDQWLALYGLITDLWAQQKVSDRVIMVGRVIQLITNCHMPREMLESALWKDIYKYKNVLNQLVDVVTEELTRSSETGKLTIDQISLGSRGMHEIIEKFLTILPKLLESLSQTIVEQLPDLVNRFFADKAAFFRVPCKGYSFAEIIPSLAGYSQQIMEIEELVCRQLKTKPNVTMSQFNNMMSSDFFAIAFNFSNYRYIQRMLEMESAHDSAPNQQAGKPLELGPNSNSTADSRPSLKVKRSNSAEPAELAANVSSVVDEMAANPRLAQIVAILQSSSLDPPEVHAELPELNWVEAGTSVALLYEAIQKLLSYEQPFNIFPEIPNFQEQLMQSVETSQQMYVKFSKRDPLRLIAYSLDTVMPIALRTYKPMDSFHLECSSSLRDIFSDDTLAVEAAASGQANNNQQQVNQQQQQRPGSRQWQCFVSSLNFAAWATNNFMRTFNSMFRNVLAHKSVALPKQAAPANASAGNGSSCIFFDGSVSAMLDNLPQFIDLSLETVLMASTSLADQQLSLYEVMCSSNYTLDPFNGRALELRAQMKDKMCHLFHKKSLENCASVLELQRWTSTMRELNTTWFEVSALTLTPSFRNITLNAHEFLELFGQFRPSTMSDSLLARVLNVNSFWTNLLNRTMSIIDKYQEKRFEFALQTLTPIIYDNLPAASTDADSNNATSGAALEVRETLTTSILGAKAILGYLIEKQKANATGGQLETQIQSLFGWADRYSMVAAEALLRTLATNITKLELMFQGPLPTGSGDVWGRFCAAPVGEFLHVLDAPTNLTMEAAREEICRFQWRAFYQQLKGPDADVLKQALEPYPVRELTRIALTKWGQLLDFMFIESKSIKQLPKFFYMEHWDHFRGKLPQISPLKDQPSNLSWIWQGAERIVRAMDAGTNQTNHPALVRVLDQLNCGLEAVKGGLSWENIANIYSDKQDILAAHSTINNGFALASIGLNTFLAHKKFQKFLDQFVKPRVGLTAFCEFRDRRQLESIFFIPNGQDFLQALESFQELLCDTNFETLAQNINPISVCYQTSTAGSGADESNPQAANDWPLADSLDRFFKLASLAVLDAKLVAASDAKPPILDKDQWASFWAWWRGAGSGSESGGGAPLEPEARKARIALALVRAFQTIDSVNADHVVWQALFRSIHEVSEVTAYLLRAVERKNPDSQVETELGSRLSMVKEAASKLDTAMKGPGAATNSSSFEQQQQQLASTLSNIMFPEVNNFISFRTFKQLRYIKTISDYFTQTLGAQALVCSVEVATNSTPSSSGDSNNNNKQQVVELAKSRLELINYKLNSNEKLFKLLCQYEPSQWLTALNIVISSRTSSIPKKVNYMTKYLSIFTRQYRTRANGSSELLESFIHGQQLENIEFVANTTVSYILATSQSIKSLSFSKISDISWHSLPNILDSIDRHLCASKYELGTFRVPQYEPKRLQLDTIVCKLPHWNITQVYNYVNENFDLQNMISLISASQRQLNTTATITKPPTGSGNSTIGPATIEEKICITPFKFASKWLKIIQETLDEFMSKASKEKIKRCLNQSRKGQSACAQALRYVKLANSLLSTVDELTQNNSWPAVKKTWASISYLLLNQSAQTFA